MQRKRYFLSVTAACLVLCGVLAAQEPAEPKLQLIVSGQAVALPAGVVKQVVGRMEGIVESSNFDSVHYPNFFRAPRTPPEQILKDSFLRLTYPRAHAFKTVGGVLTADQVEAGLTESGIPGPWLLRDHGRVIELAKYSGVECVHLARLAGLTESLPKPMQEKLPAYHHIQ